MSLLVTENYPLVYLYHIFSSIQVLLDIWIDSIPQLFFLYQLGYTGVCVVEYGDVMGSSKARSYSSSILGFLFHFLESSRVMAN